MWTNSDFKVWLEEINYSSLSQEALKQAASKFYYKFGDLNKKTVLRCVEDFVKTDNAQSRFRLSMFRGARAGASCTFLLDRVDIA